MAHPIANPKDLIAGAANVACPACGVALGGLRANDLRRITLPCRCHNGFVVHETRCGACAMVLVLTQDSSDNVVARKGAGGIRALDRDDAVRAIERRFERNDR